MRKTEAPHGLPRLARAFAALVAAVGASGCGLLNGAGLVGHALYEDEIAICRYCAEEGEVCAELDDGNWGCRPFSDLQSCDAAENLFFEHENESPFLMPMRGKTALEEGFRTDCDGGRNPFVADVLVYDLEYDTPLMTDWSLEEDGAERAELVTLTDIDQNVHQPSLWSAQAFPSSDGNDVAYRVEIVFCVSVLLERPVALQVADKAGHRSNAICLDGVE